MIVHFQGIKRTYKYYQSNGKSGNVLGIYQTSHLLGVQVKQVPNRDDVPNLTLSVGFGSKYHDQRFSITLPACIQCKILLKKLFLKNIKQRKLQI